MVFHGYHGAMSSSGQHICDSPEGSQYRQKPYEEENCNTKLQTEARMFDKSETLSGFMKTYNLQQYVHRMQLEVLIQDFNNILRKYKIPSFHGLSRAN